MAVMAAMTAAMMAVAAATQGVGVAIPEEEVVVAVHLRNRALRLTLRRPTQATIGVAGIVDRQRHTVDRQRQPLIRPSRTLVSGRQHPSTQRSHSQLLDRLRPKRPNHPPFRRPITNPRLSRFKIRRSHHF
jgi:hypothetical protein